MLDPNLSQPVPKSSFKFVSYFVIFFMLLAVVLTSILVPKVIAWYFEPPTTIGISCGPSIHWAIQRLLFAQLISLGVGALIGLLVGFRLKKR